MRHPSTKTNHLRLAFFSFLFFLVEFPVLADFEPPGQRGPVQRPRYGIPVNIVTQQEEETNENKGIKKK